MENNTAPGSTFKQTVEDLLDATFLDTEDLDDIELKMPTQGFKGTGPAELDSSPEVPKGGPTESFTL